MESACNREQFACTQCGDAGHIHVLTIMHYNNEMILYFVYMPQSYSHACNVCVILCFCASCNISGM